MGTTTASGVYKSGQTITVTVSFSEPVTVTGTPKLTLNTAPSETANYVSGSGTSTLTFSYSVAAGDMSSRLDYASATALALNGGTIQDAATNAATLTLPTPASTGDGLYTKNIVIDTGPIISITKPTNNAVFVLNQPEVATFSCADAASGIASCTAVTGTTTLSSGATLPTTQVGSHTFAVTAKSKAAWIATLTYTYVVTYSICNFAGPMSPWASPWCSPHALQLHRRQRGSVERGDYAAQHRRHDTTEACDREYIHLVVRVQGLHLRHAHLRPDQGEPCAQRVGHRGSRKPRAELHAEIMALTVP